MLASVMTVLQRFLRGSAALFFMVLGGFIIAIAYYACGGKFGWHEGSNRIIEKGPRAEWMWAAAGVMLGVLSTSVMTKQWELRKFVALPGTLGFTLLGTVLCSVFDNRNVAGPGSNPIVGLVGGVLVVLALATFFVGAARSGVAKAS